MSENEIVDPALAEARDRKAAADAKIAARAADGAAKKAIREALDGAVLSEAIAEHGDVGDAIGTVLTSIGRVIVKRPSSARWRRAESDMESRNKSKLEEAGKNLIVDCLVYPDRDAYFAIVDRYPALPVELIGMIGNLARGGALALAGE